MATKPINAGTTMPYTPSGAAATGGDLVIIGRLAGVVVRDLADGEAGDVWIDGVHDVLAVTGAVFAAGEPVVIDSSASNLVDDHNATPASGDHSVGCVAMEALTAGAGDRVRIKLNVALGTIT